MIPGTVFLLGVAIYTINFGRWVWKKGEKRGAIGIWLLTLGMVVVPVLVFFQPY